jgi:hypothetical protein
VILKNLYKPFVCADAKGIDWECGSCGNMNWSWRANCNMCNGNRPSSHLVRCCQDDIL